MTRFIKDGERMFIQGINFVVDGLIVNLVIR